MGDGAKLFFRNRWVDATLGAITSGGDVSAFPASNTQTNIPSEIWRAQNLSTAYLLRDLGADFRIGGLCVHGHNLSSAGQIRGRIADNAAMTSPLYDSGLTDAWGAVFPVGSPFGDSSQRPNAEGRELLPLPVWLQTLPSEVYARHIRIDFSDPNNQARVIEADWCYAGLVHEASPTQAFGWQLIPVSESIIKLAQTGQEWIEGQRKFFRAVGTYEGQDETAANFWTFLFNDVGLTKPFVISMRDAQTIWQAETTMLCRFTRDPFIEHQENVAGDRISVYRIEVELEEVIG